MLHPVVRPCVPVQFTRKGMAVLGSPVHARPGPLESGYARNRLEAFLLLNQPSASRFFRDFPPADRTKSRHELPAAARVYPAHKMYPATDLCLGEIWPRE